MKYVISVNDKNLKALNEWRKQQKQNRRGYMGEINMTMSYAYRNTTSKSISIGAVPAVPAADVPVRHDLPANAAG